MIPSEDEWYKAAYHKNDGVTGNYWDYPTATDELPSNDLIDPDPGNNANFDEAIGGPYWSTEVGEFENSQSPYNTFDMGGNLFEWNEAVIDVTPGHPEFPDYHSIRGSSWAEYSSQLHAAHSWAASSSSAYAARGFRVAQVPEPATMALLALGSLGILRKKRR